jgi:hypothetical protein
MDGVQDDVEREELTERLNAPPDKPAGDGSGKRTSLPLEGAPSWYNGDDDEGYSAQAAMTKLGRVRR